MKTLQLTFLFSLLTINILNAQNYVAYHNLCNEAEVQIRNGELLLAQGMLIQAISLVPKPKAIDYFNLAKCYSQSNHPDSTLKYIDLALTNSESMRSLVRRHYAWFDPILSIEEWEGIEERLKHSTTRSLTPDEEEVSAVYDRINGLSAYYSKFLNDSINSHFPVDTLLREIYMDSLRLAEVRGSEIFDSLCQKIGHFPDSHPNFEYRNYFTTRNFPITWFKKNESFLLKELQNGRFSPGHFLRYKVEEKSEETRKLVYLRSKEPYETTDEMLELINLYGVTFDWNTQWLRENQSWPYE